MPLSQNTQTNTLLRQLPAADYDRLKPELEIIAAARGHSLQAPGEKQTHVYFPLSGMASVTAQHDPMKVEIGVIGREGFVGIPILLGGESSPVATFVQLPGEFFRMPAAAFRDFVRQHPDSMAVLLRYVQSYIVQVSSTAFANGSFNVEQRLARWILMVHDRADDDRLLLTHDLMAVLLGVRRPGVTVATHVLEGEHAIKATRGAVLVTDRSRLQSFAEESYGLAEAEYERLIGAAIAKAQPSRMQRAPSVFDGNGRG